MSAARNPPVRLLNAKISKARFSERRERSERRGLLRIRPRACGAWALQIPQRAAYPCVRFWKGRERNCGDWKSENGCIHHPAGVSAGGGAFRCPRLRDADGGADARRARARVQPRRDFAARANPSARRAADCDIRAIRARYARATDCDIHANIRARHRADCARANIRARYAHACDINANPSARANCDIRAKYAHARANCDSRADCHNRANIRAGYARANNDNRDANSPNLDIRARANRHLHANARAHLDADARANRNAGSPDADLHARAAARRQRQGGQRRRRARARFHAQFRGRLIAHRRESAG